MVKRVEFNVTDEIAELLENVCLGDDLNKKAKELFLHGLSAAYGAEDDDATSGKIDGLIDQL